MTRAPARWTGAWLCVTHCSRRGSRPAGLIGIILLSDGLVLASTLVWSFAAASAGRWPWVFLSIPIAAFLSGASMSVSILSDSDSGLTPSIPSSCFFGCSLALRCSSSLVPQPGRDGERRELPQLPGETVVTDLAHNGERGNGTQRRHSRVQLKEQESPLRP